MKQAYSLVLASQSTQRKKLLLDQGLSFTCVAANIVENIDMNLPLHSALMQVSEQKLHAVLPQLDSLTWIISADTVVYKDGRILGKPQDEDEAYEFLQLLSGNIHEVYSALSLYIPHYGIHSEVVCSQIEFTSINHVQTKLYIASGEWREAAGAYRIQGMGARFIKQQLSGSYYAVMGLPLYELFRVLYHYNFFELVS